MKYAIITTDDFERDFKENFREINVEKIYFDAFLQVATPSGARFPDAKTALQQRIERGTLILNYQGHSGEFTLAEEDILNVSDIIYYISFTAAFNYLSINAIEKRRWK